MFESFQSTKTIRTVSKCDLEILPWLSWRPPKAWSRLEREKYFSVQIDENSWRNNSWPKQYLLFFQSKNELKTCHKHTKSSIYLYLCIYMSIYTYICLFIYLSIYILWKAAREREAISLSPHYPFPSYQRHLEVSQAITAED